MSEVICRDCGESCSELPDDPAPNVCPRCYVKRLARIAPELVRIVQKYKDPVISRMWLRRALIRTGGELPEWADKHAARLFGTAPGSTW
jgi:DNA-directed RNA polymerase subunit RPC12/RpoP